MHIMKNSTEKTRAEICRACGARVKGTRQQAYARGRPKHCLPCALIYQSNCGQIGRAATPQRVLKLALKLAGHPIADEEVGAVTWGVWMKKR